MITKSIYSNDPCNKSVYAYTIKNKKYYCLNDPIRYHCSREEYFKVTSESNELYYLHQSCKSMRTSLKDEFIYMANAKLYQGFGNLDYGIEYDEDDKREFYISPYYDQGTLQEFISTKHITNEQEIIEYFRQICHGVMILHQNNVIHLHLDPDNILVTNYNDKSYPYHYYFAVTKIGFSRAVSILKITKNG